MVVGLIEQEEIGLFEEHAGQADQLLFAAAEGADLLAVASAPKPRPFSTSSTWCSRV